MFVNGVVNGDIYKTERVRCLLYAPTFYAICSKIFVAIDGTWSTVSTCFGFTLCT